MNILILGDITGKPGRKVVNLLLDTIKKEYNIDLTVANGENAAGGFGFVPKLAPELFGYGIDVITGGNHIWDKKEILQLIESDDRILRPINYPDGVPGKGVKILTVKNNKIAVVSAMGRVYLSNLDCPFRVTQGLIERLKDKVKIIIIDFHAEVTSEKRAFGWFLDGKVSAVIGTHTHVQTADEEILPNGTAYITDVGMTGAFDSIIGVRKDLVFKRLILQMPVRFEMASKDLRLNAVVVEIDEESGKAKKIERIQRKVK